MISVADAVAYFMYIGGGGGGGGGIKGQFESANHLAVSTRNVFYFVARKNKKSENPSPEGIA